MSRRFLPLSLSLSLATGLEDITFKVSLMAISHCYLAAKSTSQLCGDGSAPEHLHWGMNLGWAFLPLAACITYLTDFTLVEGCSKTLLAMISVGLARQTSGVRPISW